MSKIKRNSFAKVFSGEVVSVKMMKTAVVEVTRRSQHKVYKKIIKRTKSFAVHDEEGLAQLGERVKFRECAPYSKSKKWILINKTGSR